MKRLFLIISFAISLALTAAWTDAKEPCIPYDDVSKVMCRYGKPDVDDSTEFDRPRPPIVTRWIEYKKERVRASFVPEAKMTDPPPYRKWKFIGFQDTKTNAVLSVEEVIRRMQARDRNK